MSIGDLLNQAFEYSTDPRIWVIQAFVVLLLTGAVNYLASLSWRYLGRLVCRRTRVGDILIDAATLPIQIFIWLFGISVAVWIAGRSTSWPLLPYLPTAAHLVFVTLIAIFCVRFINGLQENVVDPDFVQKPLDPTTASAVGQILRVAVYITAALVMLQSLGYSISGVLAFGGIGGLAVGFAAKDMLSNFLGAMVLYMEKPFKVGDWIRSPEQQIEGTVIEIGWRATRIRRFDTVPIYVPNSVLTSIVLENPSRMLNRRIQESWDVRFHDWNQVPSCVEAVRAMLTSHPDLDTHRLPRVNFDDFSSSGMRLWIYGFTKTADWDRYLKVREDILLKIIAIVHEHDAEMSLPLQKVEIWEKNAQKDPGKAKEDAS